MSAARRLVRFRAALVAFVVMTILLAFIALPTIERIAHRQSMAVGWMPVEGAQFVAVGILLVWWAAFLAMWFIEERRLYANRRRAARIVQRRRAAWS
jgi:hypothetical protein